MLQCDHLRRLPLAKQNTDTINEIKGDLQWWSALEWDDEETKLSMLPYFHSYGGNWKWNNC